MMKGRVLLIYIAHLDNTSQAQPLVDTPEHSIQEIDGQSLRIDSTKCIWQSMV